MKLVKEGDFVVGMSDETYRKEFKKLDDILHKLHEERLVNDIMISINRSYPKEGEETRIPIKRIKRN